MRPESPVVRGQLWESQVLEGGRVDWDGPGGRAHKYDLLGIGVGGREGQSQ
jgi:hypothetical protein